MDFDYNCTRLRDRASPMRYLVLSDIHANLTALEACLAAAQGRWERILCLGDLADYGPDPNEVAERVRALAPTIIRGNHDKVVTGLSNLAVFNPLAQIAARWTHDQLLARKFQIPGRVARRPDVRRWTHAGSRRISTTRMSMSFSPAQAMGGLAESPSVVTFFGHTHYQGGFSYRDSQINVIQLRPEPGPKFAALRLEPGTRYLLNPGSIGQPRDGDPRAAFAIADLDHQVIEFLAWWPYDISAVQERVCKQPACPIR